MPKYICPTCNAGKDTKTAYNAHLALCKILSISAKERKQQKDEFEQEPSIHEIFQIGDYL